jgi:malonyl-CoA O-methyltransferase
MIQREIARELASRLELAAGGLLLDVGAGTGALLADINRRWPQQCPVALDVASGMIEQGRRDARGLRWVQADAGALPFRRNVFDAVVSASSYQWVEDLPAAFRSVRKVLKPGGVFQAAFFGHDTLREFFAALEFAALLGSRKDVFELGRLPTSGTVESALSQARFDSWQTRAQQRTVVFSDLRGILRWLRSVGGNSLRSNFFLGPQLLRRAEMYYREKFPQRNGLVATFEIIWITAQKATEEWDG